MAIGALGVAGLAGTPVIAQKATEKARGELQQIHDWGTVVGTSNNEQLTNFQEKLENFNAAFSLLRVQEQMQPKMSHKLLKIWV
ncbi:hypothetical protein ACN9TB_01020 [Lactococcus lactis]